MTRFCILISFVSDEINFHGGGRVDGKEVNFACHSLIRLSVGAKQTSPNAHNRISKSKKFITALLSHDDNLHANSTAPRQGNESQSWLSESESAPTPGMILYGANGYGTVAG